MPLTYQQIVAEAMKLSPQERADLADRLWISVDAPEVVAAAWEAEIKRRVAQLDAGEVETIPFEQVLAELRVKLRWCALRCTLPLGANRTSQSTGTLPRPARLSLPDLSTNLNTSRRC